MGIYCLVVTRGLLNDYLQEVLLLGAMRLMRERTGRCKLNTSRCEGFVVTEFAHATLGSVSGIKFMASLESNNGRIDVSYIVRPRDVPASMLDPKEFAKLEEEGFSFVEVQGLEITDAEIESFHDVAPAEMFLN